MYVIKYKANKGIVVVVVVVVVVLVFESKGLYSFSIKSILCH